MGPDVSFLVGRVSLSWWVCEGAMVPLMGLLGTQNSEAGATSVGCRSQFGENAVFLCGSHSERRPRDHLILVQASLPKGPRHAFSCICSFSPKLLPSWGTSSRPTAETSVTDACLLFCLVSKGVLVWGWVFQLRERLGQSTRSVMGLECFSLKNMSGLASERRFLLLRSRRLRRPVSLLVTHVVSFRPARCLQIWLSKGVLPFQRKGLGLATYRSSARTLYFMSTFQEMTSYALLNPPGKVIVNYREASTWNRTRRRSQGHTHSSEGQAGLEPGTSLVHCLQLGTLFPSLPSSALCPCLLSRALV